jgi:hypothetical protein
MSQCSLLYVAIDPHINESVRMNRYLDALERLGACPEDIPESIFRGYAIYCLKGMLEMAGRCRIDGQLGVVSPSALARSCDWTLKPATFFAALRESGWLVMAEASDPEAEPQYLIEGWDRHAGRAYSKRKQDAMDQATRRDRARTVQGQEADSARTVQGQEVDRLRTQRDKKRLQRQRRRLLAAKSVSLTSVLEEQVQLQDQEQSSLSPPPENLPSSTAPRSARPDDPARSPREAAPELAAKRARPERPAIDKDALLSRRVTPAPKPQPSVQLQPSPNTAMALQGSARGLGEPQILNAGTTLGEPASEACAALQSKAQLVDLYCRELNVCLDATIKMKDMRTLAELAGKVTRQDALDAHHDASAYAAGKGDKAGLPLILLKLKGALAQRMAPKAQAPDQHLGDPSAPASIRRYSRKEEAFKLRQQQGDILFMQELKRKEAEKLAFKSTKGTK